MAKRTVPMMPRTLAARAVPRFSGGRRPDSIARSSRFANHQAMGAKMVRKIPMMPRPTARVAWLFSGYPLWSAGNSGSVTRAVSQGLVGKRRR